MHDNVWEWLQDRYGKYPAGPVTDSKGSSSGMERVYPEGSWAKLARKTGSATSGRVIPDYSGSNDGGFRIAMSL